MVFCESCGAKVGRTNWTCKSGHQVEAQYKFCLLCGAAEGAAASSATFSPPVPSSSRQDINPSAIFEPPRNAITSTPNYGESDVSTGDEDVSASFSQPVRQANSSGKIFGIISGVLVLLVIGAVAINNASTPSITNVTVTETVLGQSCYNLSWGYGDIPGAQVVITADGAQVGFGSYPSVGIDNGSGCEFSTTVYDVPMDAANYSVAMASGRRGVIYNTQSELAGNDWTFSLTLGP